MALPALPAVPRASPGVDAFLQPLRVDADRIYTMACEFSAIFTRLAAESLDQFLPTPVSESILLPSRRKTDGRYLAIDIGGTNLRVGFVELGDGGHNGQPLSNGHQNGAPVPATTTSLRRLHERSWSILDHLKSENADSLFAWIGACIAAVVHDGCASLGLPRDAPVPMGVTFSFPMQQQSLSQASLMSMGKGFAMTSKLDLGSHLVRGYDQARLEYGHKENSVLPPITIAAISNDSVSTLVSFVYEVPAAANQKPAMGVICGTGSNATLLLKRSKLHPSKRAAGPSSLDSFDGPAADERIAVNTEWSINGSAPAMRAVDLISRWDDQLSASVESPGFQPLEYMTSGRYLGELGRIMLLDYMTSVLGVDAAAVPRKLLCPFAPRNTMFLGRFRPGQARPLRALLEAEFPSRGENLFVWTDDMADALYHIAKAIQTRAAAILAAAIVGLLDCADELPAPGLLSRDVVSLVVGYTGGCITNFQDYLGDCQAFLDVLVARRYGGEAAAPVRVVLSPCHDGGIKGAGILVPAALAQG